MDVTPDKRGSFENYTVQLAARLHAGGWRSVQAFWGPPPAWLDRELRAAGGEVLVLSEEPELRGRAAWPPGPARDTQMARLMQRLARRYAPDIVHLHFCVLFSLLPFALRLGGAKGIIATEHISLPIQRRSLPRDLLVRARNAACLLPVRHILSVSGFVRRRLIESDHVPPSKITVLYNGIDLDRFSAPAESRAAIRRRLGLPEDHGIVTSVGQLIDSKGIDYLIEAASALGEMPDRPGRPPTTWLVVGDGDRREALMSKAQGLGLGERMRFLGKRDDVQAILAASDVFVFPSVWDEALGYVLLEAMAMGVPIVASRVGGIPEVIRDGENGLLVPPRDVGAMTQAIARLLDDPVGRETIGRQGRRTVEERFSIASMVNATAAVYAEVAGRPL
jgi:glycosyltransferase involved in cell wall biosynthesis